MSRLAIPAREDAPAAAQPLLDAVERQLGVVPNLFRLVATSPATLEGYLGLNAALGRTLDAKTRERIAIAVAQANGCDYCLSAHTYLGLNLAKIDEAEIALNRAGHSGDAKADAAIVFARQVLAARGKVSEADIAAVRLVGFSEAQVIEIVASVALNVLTNYINNVAETDIDFPVVLAAQAA
ncbi:carboxymuconolactone decarboxylase family protein [Sphingomonas sp. TF3]|uniref:carboxymuconolactone decarboxylase family protein n=1 Tax=Sphingomonas sp. TF3 TaxID=2495580 RepID=UPI000F8795A2|nr:carboxymuconolactone decarboxylase family protein [Sphingomonas sp. TF3]RUN75147.1 carboxymuconolactone decarboxylase family protein [Sphingomonas sp. TF3]